MRAQQLADVEYLHVLPGNCDHALVLGLSSPSLLSYRVRGGGHTVLGELGLSEGEHSFTQITERIQNVLHPDYLESIQNGATYLHLGDLL